MRTFRVKMYAAARACFSWHSSILACGRPTGNRKLIWSGLIMIAADDFAVMTSKTLVPLLAVVVACMGSTRDTSGNFAYEATGSCQV